MMSKLYTYSICYAFLVFSCSQSQAEDIMKSNAVRDHNTVESSVNEQIQTEANEAIIEQTDIVPEESNSKTDIVLDNISTNDNLPDEHNQSFSNDSTITNISITNETEPKKEIPENIVHLNDENRTADIVTDTSEITNIKDEITLDATSEITNIVVGNPTVTADATAPSYNKVLPVKGWNRFSCDSAGSLKEWGRWWQYLRMKQPVVMDWIDGLLLRIYPNNEIYRALYVKGIYDPNFIVVVNTILSKGGTFIDVGANIGHFSLLASRTVGNEGHVIAIEPSSRDYNRLIDNIKINKLENIISAYRFIISDVDNGTSSLKIACEERNALNTIGKEFSTKGIDTVQTEEVDLMSIDTFVRTNGISQIEVLKLDIEGSELNALKGARNVIEKFRPAIMLGINAASLAACNANRKEVQQILTELRYKAYKLVKSPRFALEPIDDIVTCNQSVVFCMHESVIPPELPQPIEKSIRQKIQDFFTL